MIVGLKRGPLDSETVNGTSPKLSFVELRRLTDLLYDRTGMRFGPKRFGTVRTCVLKRMLALGHSTLDEYIAYAGHPDNGMEWKTLADLMVADGG